MSTITVDLSKEFQEAKQLLEAYPEKAERVMRSVANRVLDGVKTDVAKLTSSKYLVTSTEVQKTFQFRRNGAVPKLVSRGRRRSLVHYAVNPSKVVKGQARERLQGAVKRAGLRPLGPAFLARRGKRWYPYYRTGSAAGSDDRFAGLEAIVSPAIPQLTGNTETVAEVEKNAIERFQKRFTHELGRVQA